MGEKFISELEYNTSIIHGRTHAENILYVPYYSNHS